MTAKTRIETDTMGEMKVPAERLWGSANPAVARELQDRRRPHADRADPCPGPGEAGGGPGESRPGKFKDPAIAKAIIAAADEVIAGRHDAEFPLVVWQTGSGTQTNMNVNEVIANRASELLGRRAGHGPEGSPQRSCQHGPVVERCLPHGDACRGRDGARGRLIPSVGVLRTTLAQKAATFRDIVKIGRTHLMDATPLTLGQEISGWVQLLDNGLKHVEESIPHLCELALGGTAVGTGLNAHPEFAVRVAAELARLTGLPVRHRPQQVRGTFGPRRPCCSPTGRSRRWRPR